MAKMFYSLEEAAQRLGVNEDQLKQLAASGKLQQFRDRDKLMFKRDQVDAMATKSADAGDSAGPIPLVDSADTDRIDLKAESRTPDRKEDPRQATGISVFDADEIEQADPMAQTQVTQSVADEDLALESVGSGSGLLDLTRESDDTSLGAELLDEIYPGESDAKMGSKAAAAAGASGSFASAIAAEASGSSGLENLAPVATSEPQIVEVPASEPYDPAGSGLGMGLLLGALVALVIALIIGMSGARGIPDALASKLAQSSMHLIVPAGILAVSVILGVIGLIVGKARS